MTTPPYTQSPTLILHGDDDQIVPIAASAMLSSKIVKNAKLSARTFVIGCAATARCRSGLAAAATAMVMKVRRSTALSTDCTNSHCRLLTS
jgi:pimeloyl-ACP methyl ester carboxylesterase